MRDAPIHVYLMPGMAASPNIFKNIKLPEDRFKIHLLEWFVPKKTDTLIDYAIKMCEEIKHDNSVLLGVSFGGVLVQEMNKYLKLKKLIVVSSIKSKHELPKRLKFLKVSGAYKILPTSMVKNIDVLAKFSFGATVNKRIKLYQQYLSVNDEHYLDWSIKQMIFWNQEEPIKEAIYINGDKDIVFPHSCTGNCIVVEGGTHIMVIDRFRWFNENLPHLINDTFNIEAS